MENMDKGLDSLYQMGADSFGQNLSGQAKKFWISMKKGFIGVRSLWVVGSVEQDTS